MKNISRLRMLASLLLIFLAVNPLRAGSNESVILENANDVLKDLVAIPLKGIPLNLLHDAQGVAIVPDLLKAGLIIGGRHGRGVLLVREPDGSWGPPIIVTLSGVSIGHQIGVQSTDLVLVFMTRGGLDRIRRGKLTLGVNAAAAAGPVGRQAEISTDARFKSEILSYSRSRGLFAGVSLEGAALMIDAAATDACNHSASVGWLDSPSGEKTPQTPPGIRLQQMMDLLTASVPFTPVEPLPVIPPSVTPSPEPSLSSPPSVPH